MNNKTDKKTPSTSLAEEIANSVTHGIGAGLSIAGLVVLVVLAVINGDAWHVVSVSIYGTSLVLLYLASTLYHSVLKPKAKRQLKILDHAAIYLLIAGTYTPFMLVNLRGPWGWSLLGTVWGLAIAGIVFKIFFIGRFERLSLAIYLLMGWLCVIAARPMITEIPTGGLIWLALGGVFYSLGVIFYRWEMLRFNHAIWHLFVLAGSICHYFAILLFVLPQM
ncbi:hemolysin III family protein [Roseivirga sp. BDSF3-8]|uniref:PAQR family membrane homeostasis protein TrhA n=1 Tax=Roseivirga sp. BDSF3-8 TaxID=3241598 RepID=UPI003531F8E0